jgi:MFS family permease
VLFASGSAAVGTAGSTLVFLSGRALQGLGAGLMVVVLYVLVVRRYTDELRPKVFAVMASAWVIPSVAGPPLAAFVTQQVGWRWIFLAIPPLLIAGVMALAPELRAARLTNVDGDQPHKFGMLSVYAAGTAAGGTLLQYAAQSGSRSTTAVGTISAIALLTISVPPLLPAGTLRARPGTPAFVLLRGLLAGAFFGTEVLFPLLVASRPGGNAILGGLLLAAGSIGWAGGSWSQSRLARRQPARPLLVASCLLMTGGILVTMTALYAHTPLAIAGVGWCIAGIGMGAGLATVNRSALESSAETQHGTTSSALQVSDALASIVTTGVGAAIVTNSTPSSSPGRFAMVLTATATIALLAAGVAFRRAGGQMDDPGTRADSP